jgi:ABC-type phosphate/phosphonate transport system substrate-binding protein
MIAALPMYDRIELREATDAFWALIRHSLLDQQIDAPASLTRDVDPWSIWTDPRLIFAQTCGLPYRARLHGKVTLLGTPDYGLPGCPAGYYNSVLVVNARASERPIAEVLRGRLAINEGLSQSGWAAIHAFAADLGIALTPALKTGAHVLSARAVAQGQADLAAIDALSWHYIQRFDPMIAENLREVARTNPTPALPYITAKSIDRAAILQALNLAITKLAPRYRDDLQVNTAIAIPAEAYLAIPNPPKV